MSIFDLHASLLADYRDFVRWMFLNAGQHPTAFVGRGRPSTTHRNSARVK